MPKDHNYKDFPELTNNQFNEEQFASPHKQIFEDFEATVKKVHDGDTITVVTDFRDFAFPIRFANIDAPELNEGGELTRDYLKSIILNQKVQIRVNVNNRVDKYGRLIGEVIYHGLSMNETLLQLAYAVPFGFRKEGKIPQVEEWFSM